MTYSFNEIVSTRRLGSRASGKHFVDLKLGNLMVQRVTRCETRQVRLVLACPLSAHQCIKGMEITSIISAYIQAFVETSRPA